MCYNLEVQGRDYSELCNQNITRARDKEKLMARKERYKNTKRGIPITPEEYREIQSKIDNLQIQRSKEGVDKSKKTRILLGNESKSQYRKSRKRQAARERIHELERYARE